MEKIFKGAFESFGALTSLPGTIQKLLIAITVVGGICILALVLSMAWSIGSGGKTATTLIETAGKAIPTT